MTKYGRIILCVALFMAIVSLKGQTPGLCMRVDMKPVLSLEQIRMADLVDFICEISGLKQLPTWPSADEISKMDPAQYYQMEVKMLVDNGFPPIFMDIEPERLVNRRFFASLMFQIAMEVDEKVKTDCANVTTETEQLECLVQHDWLYSKAGKIYREEILSILCAKKDEIHKELPPPVILPPEIYPEEFKEGILETPATPIEE